MGGNFLFRIDGVTPDPQVLCDDLAFSEGQRLVSFVDQNLGQKIDVTDARCVDPGSYGSLPHWQIEISYTAPSQLPVVSTHEVFSYFKPHYPTREACEATIDQEKEIFARQTKLPIFLSYCVIPSYSTDSWEINVTSFGRPERRPYAASSNVFGTILGHDRESFNSMISREFAKYGFEVAQVSLESALTHQNLAVRYYGQELIRFEETNIADFQTPAECTELVNQTQSALNEADLKNFGVYCERDPLVRTGATLIGLTQSPTSLLVINPGTVYETLESCQASKDAVTDHYRTNLRRDIKASFCSFKPDTKKFAVILVEKKKS